MVLYFRKSDFLFFKIIIVSRELIFFHFQFSFFFFFFFFSSLSETNHHRIRYSACRRQEESRPQQQQRADISHRQSGHLPQAAAGPDCCFVWRQEARVTAHKEPQAHKTGASSQVHRRAAARLSKHPRGAPQELYHQTSSKGIRVDFSLLLFSFLRSFLLFLISFFFLFFLISLRSLIHSLYIFHLVFITFIIVFYLFIFIFFSANSQIWPHSKNRSHSRWALECIQRRQSGERSTTLCKRQGAKGMYDLPVLYLLI